MSTILRFRRALHSIVDQASLAYKFLAVFLRCPNAAESRYGKGHDRRQLLVTMRTCRRTACCGRLRHLRSESHPLYYLALSIFMWFLLFGAGVATPSQPYKGSHRQQLVQSRRVSSSHRGSPTHPDRLERGHSPHGLRRDHGLLHAHQPRSSVLHRRPWRTPPPTSQSSSKSRRIQDIKLDDLPLPYPGLPRCSTACACTHRHRRRPPS